MVQRRLNVFPILFAALTLVGSSQAFASSAPRYAMIHCLDIAARQDPAIASEHGKFVYGTNTEPSHAMDRYNSIVITPNSLSKSGLSAAIRIAGLKTLKMNDDDHVESKTRFERNADVQVVVEEDHWEFDFTDLRLQRIGSGEGYTHQSELGTSLAVTLEFPGMKSGKIDMECLVVKRAL